MPKIQVQCIICSETKEITPYSKRRNEKANNGNYICLSCKNKLPEIREKQSKAHYKGGSSYDKKVNVACDICGTLFRINYRTLRANKKRNGGTYQCNRCSLKVAHRGGRFNHIYDDEFRKKLKGASESFWAENRGKWKEKFSGNEFRAKMSKCGKRAWTPEFKEKIKRIQQSEEHKSKMKQVFESQNFRDKQRDRYKNVEFRKKMEQITQSKEWKLRSSTESKKRWASKEFRERMLRIFNSPDYREKMAVVRSLQPRISSQQEMLYRLLNTLNVQYHREGSETRIGHYVFDCFIPKQHRLKRNLLIEVQGDYWHTLEDVGRRDRGKFTYVDRYFPDYEIMYIWEREFYTKDRVLNRLKNKLGIDMNLVDFSFNDVFIRPCDRNSNKEFLDLYHYLGPNRGGTVYGAYLGDELIAVCQFSRPVRKEVATSKSYDYDQVLELSRFCIHPSYQKKNFASWFISRATNMVVNDVSPQLLVAFSDTTMGHQGTIYKASNWTLDGEVKPDYWYVDEEGFVMHKKTLYQRAVKMKKKEREFAGENGYTKVWGGKKLRFIKTVV